MLEPFEHPIATVQYLMSFTADYADKDLVFSDLLRIAQNDKTRTLGMALLCLGLWPTLDKIYQLHKPNYPRDTDNLVSELWDCFALVVCRVQLKRIHKVAATLSMNTKRTYYYRLVKQKKVEAREKLCGREDQFPVPCNVCELTNVSDLGIPPGFSPIEETKRLTEVLEPIVWDGADLVTGKLVYGESHKELSARHQINYHSERYRYRQAVEILRKELGSKNK